MSDRSRKSAKAAAKQKTSKNLVPVPFFFFLPTTIFLAQRWGLGLLLHASVHYLCSRRAHCPRRCWLIGCRRRGLRVVKIGLGGEVLVLALFSFEAL